MTNPNGECEYCKQAIQNMDEALNQFYEQRAANEQLVKDAEYYRRKADDMQSAYEAKIQDFAKETLINSQLRQRLAGNVRKPDGSIDYHELDAAFDG